MDLPVANHKRSRGKRKTAVHFGMFLLLFLPLYRGMQWRTVLPSTSAITTERVDLSVINGVVGELAVGTALASNAETSQDKMNEDNVGMKTAASAPVDDSFQPQNLVSAKQVPCGKEKCFFQLKSDNSLGYLVSRTEDREDRRERFETLEAGWQLAQSLKQEYGIQHFLLAPPQTITVSQQLEAPLNQNLWSEKFEKRWKKNHKRFPKKSTAYIQKVQVAPKQTLLLGCSASKLGPFHKHVQDFMQEVKHKKSFARRVKENLAQARRILEREPCMIKDFQVLLDTKGQVYHLDLDRCFMPDDASTKYKISKEETSSCLSLLDEIETQLELNLDV